MPLVLRRKLSENDRTAASTYIQITECTHGHVVSTKGDGDDMPTSRELSSGVASDAAESRWYQSQLFVRSYSLLARYYILAPNLSSPEPISRPQQHQLSAQFFYRIQVDCVIYARSDSSPLPLPAIVLHQSIVSIITVLAAGGSATHILSEELVESSCVAVNRAVAAGRS